MYLNLNFLIGCHKTITNFQNQVYNAELDANKMFIWNYHLEWFWNKLIHVVYYIIENVFAHSYDYAGYWQLFKQPFPFHR